MLCRYGLLNILTKVHSRGVGNGCFQSENLSLQLIYINCTNVFRQHDSYGTGFLFTLDMLFLLRHNAMSAGLSGYK